MANELPVCSAIPTATGVKATTVPTDVPIDNDIKHAAKNKPGSSMLAGNNRKVRFTVASIAPILLAVVAKAPARTKIHIINMIFSSPAPREKILMRSRNLIFLVIPIAYAEAIKKATVNGNS